MILEAGEGLQTETQQNAGQHRGGQRMGNDFHQPGKQAGNAAEDDQRIGEDKYPHRLRGRVTPAGR